jgi:hypothetical protein
VEKWPTASGKLASSNGAGRPRPPPCVRARRAGPPQRGHHSVACTKGGPASGPKGVRCSRPLPATRKWPSLERSCIRKRGGGKVAGRPKETLASCGCLALGPCKRTLGMPAGSAVGKSGRPPQRHLRGTLSKLRCKRRGRPEQCQLRGGENGNVVAYDLATTIGTTLRLGGAYGQQATRQ